MQAETIDDLIERSSLGTSVARQLRGRTSTEMVDAVRFKAGIVPQTDNESRRFILPNPNDRYVVRNPDGAWDVRAGDATPTHPRTANVKAIDA